MDHHRVSQNKMNITNIRTIILRGIYSFTDFYYILLHELHLNRSLLLSSMFVSNQQMGN